MIAIPRECVGGGFAYASRNATGSALVLKTLTQIVNTLPFYKYY